MTEPVILVPLDGSEPALAALPVAKVLGDIEHATLHLLHVAESKQPDAERLGPRRLEGPEFNGLTVATHTGEAGAEILRTAERIDPLLIVLCKHTASEPRDALGRTAMTVLRNARCPVVLVPPGRGPAPWHLHHVLVPHDGTPGTSTALRPARQIAEHAGAEMLVVHVTSPTPAPDEPGAFTTSRYVDQPQHEWPAWSSEFVKRLACFCPMGHLRARLCLLHGNPAAEVIRLAKEQSADLIVLAWRGAWEAPRAAILKDIVAQARCPIVVVRRLEPDLLDRLAK